VLNGNGAREARPVLNGNGDLPTTDESLMERVKSSDVDAFEQLFDRHGARAFRVARSICHDDGRAQDAVQEGFHAIWQSRDAYHPEDGSFKGWAMTVVRRRAIDSVRHEGSRPPIREDRPDAHDRDQPGPHDEAVARDEAASLQTAIKRLPERQAEVIGLAFFGELSHTEIAERLQLPTGTVKGRMRLGLEKLRRELVMSRS